MHGEQKTLWCNERCITEVLFAISLISTTFSSGVSLQRDELCVETDVMVKQLTKRRIVPIDNRERKRDLREVKTMMKNIKNNRFSAGKEQRTTIFRMPIQLLHDYDIQLKVTIRV